MRLEDDPMVVVTLNEMKKAGSLKKAMGDGSAVDFIAALRAFVSNAAPSMPAGDADAAVIRMWQSVVGALGAGFVTPGSGTPMTKMTNDFGPPSKDASLEAARDAIGALGNELLQKAHRLGNSSAPPPAPFHLTHEDIAGPSKITKDEGPGDLFGVSRLRKTRQSQSDDDGREPVRKGLDG
jgi:hypothetical protein